MNLYLLNLNYFLQGLNPVQEQSLDLMCAGATDTTANHKPLLRMPVWDSKQRHGPDIAAHIQLYTVFSTQGWIQKLGGGGGGGGWKGSTHQLS